MKRFKTTFDSDFVEFGDYFLPTRMGMRVGKNEMIPCPATVKIESPNVLRSSPNLSTTIPTKSANTMFGM